VEVIEYQIWYSGVCSLGVSVTYSFGSVPSFVIKEASLGSVDIVDHGTHFTLYNNGDRWMVCEKDSDLQIKELYSSYDTAVGDILVSGLGFGILALWLSSKPNVTSVTVIEFSQDVIDLFKQSNDVPDNLTIIHGDIINYNTDKHYDVILLDHYERQTFDWRIKDMNRICQRISHKAFWAYSLEAIYLFKMYSDDKREQQLNVGNIISKSGYDLSKSWDKFVDEFFPQEQSLKAISESQLNEYIYDYFNLVN